MNRDYDPVIFLEKKACCEFYVKGFFDRFKMINHLIFIIIELYYILFFFFAFLQQYL